MAFRYRIVTEWSDEDQVFVSRVPALGPGCAAHRDTPEQAGKEVTVAAELILESLAEHGDPIPSPDASADYSGKLGLRLPKSMHEQVARLAAADDVSINTKLLTLIAHGLGQHAEQGRVQPVPAKKPSQQRTARQTFKARAASVDPMPSPYSRAKVKKRKAG